MSTETGDCFKFYELAWLGYLLIFYLFFSLCLAKYTKNVYRETFDLYIVFF